MKKQIEQDERVLAQKRKIGNDAYIILSVGLIISVLVQQYLFNAPFSQYAVEIILFIATAVYVVIRNIASGNNLFDSKQGGPATVLINSLVCGTTVTLINTVLNYLKYSENTPLPIGTNTVLVALITFVSSTVIAFIPLELIYLANKKKQQNIESRLNKDE